MKDTPKASLRKYDRDVALRFPERKTHPVMKEIPTRGLGAKKNDTDLSRVSERSDNSGKPVATYQVASTVPGGVATNPIDADQS